MAALKFPLDETSYKGELRFTLVDKNERSDVSGASNGATISLYLPQGLQYNDKAEYEAPELGALGGAVADGQAPEGFSIPSEQLSSSGVQGLLVNSITNVFSPTAAAASRARNKVAPNPNTRALFKQVSLRTFNFQFKLQPRSEAEAQSIAAIIKKFRTELYPEQIPFEAAGIDASLGYKFPNRFKIEQFYDGNSLPTQKIAPAYLDSFATNYNAQSQAFLMGSSRQPYFSDIDISMTFQESKPLSRKDIGEGF